MTLPLPQPPLILLNLEGATLPFHMDWMRALAELRTRTSTHFFQFWSLFGEIEGYVLIIALIFAVFDKRLGTRMAVLVLLAMSLNHILKTIIQNPRPFVFEGSWMQKWAVPPENARELVAEFSTPSGHAMAAAAAYGFIALSVKDRAVKLLAIAVLALTGLSRPYLGVHYVEDIALGWLIGLGLAWLAFRWGDRIARTWQRLGLIPGLGLCSAATAAIWLGTITATSGQLAGQPNAFLSYLGFLTGLCVAMPLEARYVNFQPAGERWMQKLARYFLCVLLVGLTLGLLDSGFSRLTDDDSFSGDVLRYFRYALASVAGFFIAPLALARIFEAQAGFKASG